MANLSTNLPLIDVPLVNENGNITEAWFLFLVQLFRRTGGESGGGSTSLTVGDVLALEETFAPSVANPDEALPEMVLAPLGSAGDRMAEMVLAYVGPRVIDQTFTAGVDFTPGTTATLVLDTSFAEASHLWVFFDAAFQGDDQYILSGTSLTFSDAIPVGVNKVYVKGLM